ncbi:MAG: SLBB domain-containing protein [Gammaproteobacteria bacterium]|nr:SLBB domain-containing protein [Gammaproteobacteria bacterium]
MVKNNMMQRLAIPFLMLAALALAHALPAQAATPTAQQIEQFKKLPKAQQEALARQYGIPLNALGGTAMPTAEPVDPISVSARPDAFSAEPDFSNLLAVEPAPDVVKPFGYDLFAGAPSTFAPLDYAPVPANYILGPGDGLRIQILGKEPAIHDLLVNREGDLDFPDLGPINVAGLSFDEAKTVIADQLQQRMIGATAHVTMGQLRPIQVFVMGEAWQPGSYTVSALSTITNTLFAAGGVKPMASLRNIQLKRAGELVATLDLYDLLIDGDTTNDLMLKPGDVVLVPTVGQTMTVDGQVRRPAIYEIKKSETISDALRFAGGWLPDGYPAGATLERYGARNQRQVETLNLAAAKAGGRAVKDGDRLTIPATSSRFDANVTVIGAVVRPGGHAFVEGMRLTSLIDSPTGDLLAEADLDYTLIVRERNIRGDIDVIQTSLGDAIEAPGGSADVRLQARDKVLVFSRHERKPKDLTELDQFAGTSEQLQKRRDEMLEARKADNIYWKEYLAEFFGLDSNVETLEQDIDTKLKELKVSERSLEQMIAAVDEQGGDIGDVRDARDFSRSRLLAPVISSLERQAGAGDPVQLVEISGAVKYPGIYPLPSNGKVGDLIKAAGGLTEIAFTGNAELTRTELVGDQQARVTHLRFNVASALTGALSDNLALASKDRVIIQTLPEFIADSTIELVGEVRFPGTYAFGRGETLSDVIERAGGFTDQAHMSAAILTRESIRKQEMEYIERISEDMRKELASMSLRTSTGAGQLVDYSQLQQLMNDLTRIKPVGRLVVDVPALMNGDSNNNVRLEPGDKLYIPAFRNIINVVGQAQLPTTHLYQPGTTVDDYLRLSGGLKRQADDDRIYVLKANGAVRMPNSGFWFSAASSDSMLEPGDTIVVPLDVNYRDNLTLWTNVTQILYNTGVAVAAIAAVI